MLERKEAADTGESNSGQDPDQPLAQFLIVTLPHPQMSGSDYLTDAMLESLRRAIEAPRQLVNRISPDKQANDLKTPGKNDKAGKEQTGSTDLSEKPVVRRGPILDRYWLPWSASDPVHWEDFGPGRPGMLVFRELSRGQRERFVAVLVVSEHPAIGIDRRAMQAALHLVNELQDAEDYRIRILGPTFTGAEDSLAQSIYEFQCKHAATPITIRLVNGSATALDRKSFVDAAKPAKIIYSTTVIPDEILQDHLLYFLAGEPGSRDLSRLGSIALLVESDTGFGQQNAALMSRLREHEGLDFTVIPFPQHVSSVLGTYQAKRQQAFEGLPELQSSEIEIGIPFETRDMRHRRLASYEPELTAVRVDLLLREITRSLRERRTQYVGIVATRSLDKLFLAALVRKACPDARLFTTLSDVIVTHPDVSTDLAGMVVASTYPLYRANQDWSDPGASRVRMAFGHQSELGVYNAVQVLLENTAGMMEYENPFHSIRAKVPSTQPPVWIGVVGRDAIYPLKCYDLETSPLSTMPLHVREVAPKRDDPTKKPLPLQRARCELFAKPTPYIRCADGGKSNLPDKATLESRSDPGANLWWLLACTAASMSSIWICHYAAHLTYPYHWRTRNLAVVVLAGLFMFWVAAAWLLRGVAWRWNYGAASKAEIWAALLVSFIALATVLVNATTSRGILYARFEWPSWGRILASAVILFLSLAAWEYFVGSAAIMDATRTVNLRGGASPLIPLFLFTVCFVLLAGEQMRCVDGFTVVNRNVGVLELPESTYFEKLTHYCHDLEFRLTHPLKAREDGGQHKQRRLVHYGPYAALAGLMVIPAIIDLTSRSSLDGSWHGAICALFYIVATVMVASHLMWLHQLWSRLRDVQLELANLPFLAAFDRLPANFSHLASGGLLFWNKSNYRSMLTILRQQLSSLRAEAPPDLSHTDGPAAWKQLNDALTVQLTALATEFWPYQSVAQAYPNANPKATATAPLQGQIQSVTSKYEQSEVFAAGMLFAYTMPFLVQVRRLARALIISSTALILAMWSYPFAPSSSLRASAWLLAILTAHRIWRIAFQLNADEVVSRVVGTDPNKVTWNLDFAKTMLMFVGPFAALILYSVFGMPHEVLDWFRRLTGR